MPYHFSRRLGHLLVGLFLYGIAISAMVQAHVGIDPWDVLGQGIANRTGIPFGIVTNVVGVIVLLAWIPLRQRPGIGTVLNVLLVGTAAQFGLWLIPTPGQLWLQILLFAGGLVLLAAASGIYIGAALGPGPRDGLMTGLHARTGKPIWMMRTTVEVTVLAIGWLLGGDVGFGTLAFAVLIGPLCNLTLPLFAMRLPEPTGTATAAQAGAPAGRSAAAGAVAVAGAATNDVEIDRGHDLDEVDERQGRLIEPDAFSRARAGGADAGWVFGSIR